MSGQETAEAGSPPSMLLRGYDSVQHSVRPSKSVLSGDASRETGGSDCQISVCESLTEVASAFEIHSSLSVSYLSVASADASMDFLKSLKISTRNLVVVCRARRSGDIWTATDVELKAGKKAPATPAEAATFAKSNGDCYVDSVTLGGDYCGVYVFRTETRTEQQSLAASLKTQGIVTGVSVNASVQTKLTNFLASTNTSYIFDQKLRGTNVAMPASQDEMIAFARAFSGLTLTNPVTLGFTIRGYEDLADFGEAFNAVVDNREYFVGGGGTKGLLDDRAALISVANQTEWLRSIYATYHYSGDALLETFRAGVQFDIATIDAQIKNYKRAPATAQIRPPLPTLAMGTPVLQVQKGPLVGWGGNDGDPWNFRPVEDVIRDRVKIKSIRIGGDKFLERIEIGYKGASLEWTDIGGHKVSESLMRITLTPAEDDVISRIVARAGEFVDHLHIELSSGEHVSAGGTAGVFYEWTPGTGQFVVGFKGRLGGYVNQLQLVSASLLPAKFVKN